MSPSGIASLYKTHVRAAMEYCCPLWLKYAATALLALCLTAETRNPRSSRRTTQPPVFRPPSAKRPAYWLRSFMPLMTTAWNSLLTQSIHPSLQVCCELPTRSVLSREVMVRLEVKSLFTKTCILKGFGAPRGKNKLPTIDPISL